MRGTRSISVNYTAAGGLGLRRSSALSTAGVGKLKFWVHGGTGATKTLRVTTQSQLSGGNSPEVTFSAPANVWTEIRPGLLRRHPARSVENVLSRPVCFLAGGAFFRLYFSVGHSL
jgi:hypothetical protein